MFVHAIDIYNLLQVHCVHTPTCIHLFPAQRDCPHFPYVFFFLIITATFCMRTLLKFPVPTVPFFLYT